MTPENKIALIVMSIISLASVLALGAALFAAGL